MACFCFLLILLDSPKKKSRSFGIANRYFSAIASGGTVQQVLASRPDAEKNTAARRGGARKDGGEEVGGREGEERSMKKKKMLIGAGL